MQIDCRAKETAASREYSAMWSYDPNLPLETLLGWFLKLELELEFDFELDFELELECCNLILQLASILQLFDAATGDGKLRLHGFASLLDPEREASCSHVRHSQQLLWHGPRAFVHCIPHKYIWSLVYCWKLPLWSTGSRYYRGCKGRACFHPQTMTAAFLQYFVYTSQRLGRQPYAPVEMVWHCCSKNRSDSNVCSLYLQCRWDTCFLRENYTHLETTGVIPCDLLTSLKCEIFVLLALARRRISQAHRGNRTMMVKMMIGGAKYICIG